MDKEEIKAINNRFSDIKFRLDMLEKKLDFIDIALDRHLRLRDFCPHEPNRKIGDYAK